MAVVWIRTVTGRSSKTAERRATFGVELAIALRVWSRRRSRWRFACSPPPRGILRAKVREVMGRDTTVILAESYSDHHQLIPLSTRRPAPGHRARIACAVGLLLAATGCADAGATRPTTSGPVGGLVTPSATVTPLPFRVGSAVPGGPCLSAQLLNDQGGLVDPAQLKDARYYPAGYHWKIDSALTEASISSVTVGVDPSDGSALDVSFTAAGAREWAKVTRAAFDQGPTSPLNRIAFFFGDEVISAPTVQAPSSTQTVIVTTASSDQVTRWAAQLTAAIHEAPVPTPPPASAASCG